MTTGISSLSPNGLGFGVQYSGCLSQYMEPGSVFNGPMGMCPNFMGGGVGFTPAANNAYFNTMIQNSDNMTTLNFVNRGNQHSLGSYGEIMQKNMVEMATAIREGKMGKASKLYDEIYEAVSKNYGRETNNNSDRLDYDQSIRATISRLYEQINGYPLAKDINDNGEGYFENGFMQGLTFFGHHKNSAEETESYMTGTSIEGYPGKKFTKLLGKLTGGAISLGAAAGVGAIAATVLGAAALPFALAGAGVALLVGLVNNNSTSKVTSA